ELGQLIIADRGSQRVHGLRETGVTKAAVQLRQMRSHHLRGLPMISKFTAPLATAAVAASVLLSACGSSATAIQAPKPATPPATSGVGGGSSQLEYVKCMRAHGVPKFPDPVDGHIMLSPSSGINPDSPAFEAASQACAK